ncbi:hypothetical protein BCAH1134_C0355 (plasmid) [Bacillus cereus AH1134]|nr:hypothetical protein BCAH1134_C0355 [Bacillus cereus AH1134]
MIYFKIKWLLYNYLSTHIFFKFSKIRSHSALILNDLFF